MKRHTHNARWLSKALLGSALALLSSRAVVAQAPGGTGGGVGLGGPTLAGLGGTRPGGSTPLSAGNARAGGTTGVAATPSTANTFTNYYSSVYGVGFGPTFKLAPVVSAASSTSSSTLGGAGGLGGTGGMTGGAGGAGGASGSSGSSFTSTLNSSGAIQTLKTNSLGSPLYAVATSTTTTGTSTSSPTSFSTVGTRRAPSYVTVVGFRRTPRLAPETIQADLRQTFDRAPTLTSGPGIQIAVNGSTVVLQGTVPTIRERRVAEVLARMAPGVIDVRNQLQVPKDGLGEE